MSRRNGRWNYDDVAWRKLRLLILERDGYACQLRLPGCTLDADQVDHIIRPDDGGPRFDPGNLRAACGRCNKARGGRVGAAITNGGLSRRVPASREW